MQSVCLGCSVAQHFLQVTPEKDVFLPVESTESRESHLYSVGQQGVCISYRMNEEEDLSSEGPWELGLTV